MTRTIPLVFLLAIALAGCANKRDYGRDLGADTDMQYRELKGRESSTRTWVDRESGDGRYTERTYNPSAVKGRTLKDREYRDRDVTGRELGERKDYREHDPRKPDEE